MKLAPFVLFTAAACAIAVVALQVGYFIGLSMAAGGIPCV